MAFRETADPTRAAPDFPIQPLDQRLLAPLADISVSPFLPQIPLLARHLFFRRAGALSCCEWKALSIRLTSGILPRS